MGRFIDKIALNALIIASFYLFFMSSFNSIPVACLFTFLSASLTHKILNRLAGKWKYSRRAQKKALHRRIDALLDKWTFSKAAHAEIHEMLAHLYPECAENDVEIHIIPRPVACPPLESADCFDLWRTHRTAERLLIVCTGRVAPGTFALAQTLSAPHIRVLDRLLLHAALEKRPDLLPAASQEQKPARRKRLPLHIDRKHAPKCLLSGAMLLAMHFLLGNALYLLTGLMLLTFAGISLKKPRTPEKLF